MQVAMEFSNARKIKFRCMSKKKGNELGSGYQERMSFAITSLNCCENELIF